MKSLFSRPLLLLIIAILTLAAVYADRGVLEQRQQMVEEIQETVRVTQAQTGVTALSGSVIKVLQSTPRHRFVPDAVREKAYENRPLPIGHGQTISQPYIVALMTDMLNTEPGDTLLEVGTGSGYQAAILAGLVRHVYTIEIIDALGKSAARLLKTLGYDNITTRIGDGYYGWQEHAPFDGIIVTAAANSIPPPLIDQLKRGGRMIIPVGSAFFNQQLLLVEKNLDGQVTTRQILPVRFVPLTGDH